MYGYRRGKTTVLLVDPRGCRRTIGLDLLLKLLVLKFIFRSCFGLVLVSVCTFEITLAS